MKYLYLLLLVSSFSFAQSDNDITHRPPSFAHNGDKAVFVDFQEVTYNITYDITTKTANVRALFKMNVVEEGFPVFDLIAEPTSVKIDGIDTTAPTVTTPSGETEVRVLSNKLAIGSYELEVSAPLDTLLNFTETGVKNAFWVTDLEDRFYLERYIPTNLEYDRMKMTFEINFKGLKAPQHLFSNGKATWIDTENARIEYPDYFTVNSLYFHTTPVGSVELTQFNYTSIDGRSIPVTIYTAKGIDANSTLTSFTSKTTKTLKELEGDYGPFRHPSVTIYNANLSSMGLGGMEYAGATVTDISALSHELTHSYFARGIVPANGNAGWIDESIASWRDNGYNRSNNLSGSSRMASHATYTRKTDTAAYSFGARFMAFLDGKFATKGGLKPFLNNLLENKLFTPIFTEEFIQAMEGFYGTSLSTVFQKYVYGSSGISNKTKTMSFEKHEIHRKLDLTQMKKIL